jgi:hypothetical protein
MSTLLQLGQVVSVRAVAVMSDGSRRDLPSGTTFSWVAMDTTTLAVLNPLSAVAQYQVIKASSASEMNVIVKTPDGKTWTPQNKMPVPQQGPTPSRPSIITLPITAATQVDVEIWTV